MGVDYFKCGVCDSVLSEYCFSQCKRCYELLTQNEVEYCCKKCKYQKYKHVLCCEDCEEGKFDRILQHKSLTLEIKLCHQCFNAVKDESELNSLFEDLKKYVKNEKKS